MQQGFLSPPQSELPDLSLDLGLASSNLWQASAGSQMKLDASYFHVFSPASSRCSQVISEAMEPAYRKVHLWQDRAGASFMSQGQVGPAHSSFAKTTVAFVSLSIVPFISLSFETSPKALPAIHTA